MKQKLLLFLSLVALGSQTQSYWGPHHGYWGGGWGWGGYPYGYYGYGGYPYGYVDPVGAFVGTAGAIAATSAANRAYERDHAYYSDPNKGRRRVLVGQQFDLQQKLIGASPAETAQLKNKINDLENQINKLRE